jgi:hypothetical protein
VFSSGNLAKHGTTRQFDATPEQPVGDLPAASRVQFIGFIGGAALHDGAH